MVFADLADKRRPFLVGAHEHACMAVPSRRKNAGKKVKMSRR